MKNGFDGIRANQSPHISAGIMMDKSIRNCKAIEIYNAHELNRNRTFNNGERGEYLTDYAYKFAENELSLSKACQIVKVSEMTYCVYTPDNTSKAKQLIPKFYRMRRIKRVNGKYFTCSCGLSSRMKLPCRHIMSVVGGYEMEMFALRWLILYQHAFLKDGYDDMTTLFRKMEAEQFMRNHDIGEVIYVKNFECSSASLTYPVKIGVASGVDVENILLMIKAEGGGNSTC